MNSAEQDKWIIERVKAGENAAFKELIEKYKDDAFSLACSIVKDEGLAEDILQEVFVKVYDRIQTFKYQSSFYTWLYRIVVNRSYNELRKKRFTRLTTFEKGSKREEAANRVDNQDLKQVIQNALKQMKASEALVLRLFYLSELNIDEVVEITGFSKSKVKVTLHRARKNLAEILKKQLGKEIEDL
ncbi:MAG: RNA polymerase sigma factor [Bacteroidota bacterium]